MHQAATAQTSWRWPATEKLCCWHFLTFWVTQASWSKGTCHRNVTTSISVNILCTEWQGVFLTCSRWTCSRTSTDVVCDSCNPVGKLNAKRPCSVASNVQASITDLYDMDVQKCSLDRIFVQEPRGWLSPVLALINDGMFWNILALEFLLPWNAPSMGANILTSILVKHHRQLCFVCFECFFCVSICWDSDGSLNQIRAEPSLLPVRIWRNRKVGVLCGGRLQVSRVRWW